MPLLTLTMELLEQQHVNMNEHVEVLSDAEINTLAHRVNNAIDQPFIDVEKDMIVFTKIIKSIDRELYQLLPYEYYKLIRDETEGVSREVADEIERRVIPIIINEINIPILSEKQKEKIIGIILGLIVKAMVNGFKLNVA